MTPNESSDNHRHHHHSVRSFFCCILFMNSFFVHNIFNIDCLCFFCCCDGVHINLNESCLHAEWCVSIKFCLPALQSFEPHSIHKILSLRRKMHSTGFFSCVYCAWFCRWSAWIGVSVRLNNYCKTSKTQPFFSRSISHSIQ